MNSLVRIFPDLNKKRDEQPCVVGEKNDTGVNQACLALSLTNYLVLRKVD